ncbi:hypothetical protein WKW80_09325 [Variovorax humicola]|uniref:Uncharacterized protein n=1 Tax=Variovorax humicola TaxID=1769758 RepID=A0ABU8VWN6_9BURK
MSPNEKLRLAISETLGGRQTPAGLRTLATDPDFSTYQTVQTNGAAALLAQADVSPFAASHAADALTAAIDTR